MMLHEVLKQTGLTRKAVEYYAEQGLVSPQIKENGYREFTEADISRLKMISVYRRLGVSVAEMKGILDGDEKKALHTLLVRRSLAAKRERRRDELLSMLACGTPIEEIAPQLDALKAQETIADRLMDAFPGYFGQYVSLHFSHFLDAPIESEEQLQAYETIVRWLDHLPELELPDNLRDFLDEAAQDISAEQMGDIHGAVLAVSEDPQAYLSEHEDVIRAYLLMKDTEEYRASPAARLMEHMKDFQQQSGYIDVFLPAMQRLSPAYARYRERMEAANDAFARMFETQ